MDSTLSRFRSLIIGGRSFHGTLEDYTCFKYLRLSEEWSSNFCILDINVRMIHDSWDYCIRRRDKESRLECRSVYMTHVHTTDVSSNVYRKIMYRTRGRRCRPVIGRILEDFTSRKIKWPKISNTRRFWISEVRIVTEGFCTEFVKTRRVSSLERHRYLYHK